MQALCQGVANARGKPLDMGGFRRHGRKVAFHERGQERAKPIGDDKAAGWVDGRLAGIAIKILQSLALRPAIEGGLKARIFEAARKLSQGTLAAVVQPILRQRAACARRPAGAPEGVADAAAQNPKRLQIMSRDTSRHKIASYFVLGLGPMGIVAVS